MIGAALSGGFVCIAAIGILAVGVPAAIARVGRSVVRDALILSLPLMVSVLLVNAFLYPDDGAVAELGPVRMSVEGLALGALVAVRVVTIASALVLFSRTTRPSELVASLEVRRVPARVTFVVHQALVLIPRTFERGIQVARAQRARGFDAESGARARIRGILAVTVPTVLGAIEDAEVRTLALEARAFSRPGPRTVLWAPHDTPAQRAARWIIVLAVIVYVAGRIVRIPLPC